MTTVYVVNPILLEKKQMFPVCTNTVNSSNYCFNRQQERRYQRAAGPNEEWLHCLQYGTLQY